MTFSVSGLNGVPAAVRKCFACLVHVFFAASVLAVFKQISDLFFGTKFGTLMWRQDIDIGWLLAVFFPVFALLEALIVLPKGKRCLSVMVLGLSVLPAAYFFLYSVNWQAFDKDWVFYTTHTEVDGGELITSQFCNVRGNHLYSDCCLYYDKRVLVHDLLFRRCLKRGYEKEIHVIKAAGRKANIHVAGSKYIEIVEF